MEKKKTAGVMLLLAVLAIGCTDRTSTTGPAAVTTGALADKSSVQVSTTSGLLTALLAPETNRNIVLAPGQYDLSTTLHIPDGVTLTGSGSMRFDETSGLPSGFDPQTRTVLKAASTLAGDVVVMGNRTRMSGLTVEDAAGRTGGSVVVVHSRSAGDHVEAALEDCEIINPNLPSSSLQSVGGRALVLLTRNRETILSGFAPEIGASVSVNMSHCIVRSPRIAGIFVNNFSPRATTKIVLTENVVGGGVQLTGGTSRPDAVYGSTAIMESRRNLYRADPGSVPVNGLQVYGGAGLPTPGVNVESVTSNSARMLSIDDRIEGFMNAIVARGGSRPLASSAPISFNSAFVDLHGTTLSSVRGDLNLAGAASLVAGTWQDAGNLLRVLSEGVTGSGPRTNFYGYVVAPPSTAFGADNRLEVIGTLEAFSHTNSGIAPLPPAEFFTGAR